jgi:hypothetical protein
MSKNNIEPGLLKLYPNMYTVFQDYHHFLRYLRSYTKKGETFPITEVLLGLVTNGDIGGNMSLYQSLCESSNSHVSVTLDMTLRKNGDSLVLSMGGWHYLNGTLDYTQVLKTDVPMGDFNDWLTEDLLPVPDLNMIKYTIIKDKE